MVASILVFFLSGLYIEKIVPYNGLWLIGFTLFGVFTGFMGIFYHLKKFF